MPAGLVGKDLQRETTPLGCPAGLAKLLPGHAAVTAPTRRRSWAVGCEISFWVTVALIILQHFSFCSFPLPMYLPLLITCKEKHVAPVSGVITPQGTRGSDLAQVSGHFYTIEVLPLVVTTAALEAGRSQKYSHRQQLILLPRLKVVHSLCPAPHRSGHGHGLVGGQIVLQPNNSITQRRTTSR